MRGVNLARKYGQPDIYGPNQRLVRLLGHLDILAPPRPLSDTASTAAVIDLGLAALIAPAAVFSVAPVVRTSSISKICLLRIVPTRRFDSRQRVAGIRRRSDEDNPAWGRLEQPQRTESGLSKGAPNSFATACAKMWV